VAERATRRVTAMRVRAILALAPVILIVHVLEESPGFVPWFNAHVARGISESLFWQVNLTALAITLIVLALEWRSESTASLALAVAWLGFLFFGNALLHIAGAFVDRGYVPGLVTAIALYVPFFVILVLRARVTRRLTMQALVTCTIVGSIPMLVHAYLILFRGSRLF
jgi:hypothetical protein